MHKIALTLLAAALLACWGCSASLPQAVPGPRVVQSLEAYPFGALDGVLKEYVDTEGRVDYARLDANAAELEQYGGLLAVTGPRSTPALLPDPEHKLAWYINAYNSVAMLNVLQRYPGLENLEEIVNDFFYFTEFELDGETTDLYSLENDTIRPYAREVYLKRGAGRKLGRVHFALNCASASCPKLPNEAFDPARLDQQLERETRRFVSEARNVKVNKEARSVTLSMIFKWYAEDFVDDQGQAISPLAWINLYRDAGQQLDTSYEVKFSSYDWTLNDKTLQR